MLKIACLAGDWVCLNDDPDCVISEWHKSPYLWWNEGASIYAPDKRPDDLDVHPYCKLYCIIFETV